MLLAVQVLLDGDGSPVAEKRKPLFIVHDTDDGFIYSKTERRGRRWFACRWDEELDGGRECGTLTPEMRGGRPVYKVTGKVTVADDAEKCRKQLLARDGIEPATPVLRRTRAASPRAAELPYAQRVRRLSCGFE
jgi:hypothetical protein